jgi:NAD(P)-dependent dehydrogenase (short-subunit alcohol dehydrogenase family)
VNRRDFLYSTGALAAAPVLSGCEPGEELPLPSDVPISPYTAESTGEDVTQGIDLTGRTALVTGANSGLGYETMRVLALRGAHVIGAARTLEKARAACASVTGQTTPVAIELSDFKSVSTCIATVRQLGMPIDMLICNAGIMELPDRQLVNGLERQFVVNHLGHFILVNGLLPELLAAPQARVVVLASGQATRTAPQAGILFENLSLEGLYTPGLAYGHSKLANVLFSAELARRLKEMPGEVRVTSNAISPGVIMTNLGRHMPWWKLASARLFGWTFMRSIPQGAATTCYVATNPALDQISGHFFKDCNPHRPGGHTENGDMARRLWQVSEQLTAEYLS